MHAAIAVVLQTRNERMLAQFEKRTLWEGKVVRT